MSLNRMPTYQSPLEVQGATTRGWYTFWLGLLQGQPSGTPVGITVGVSPFSYVAPNGGNVVVSGGTVSQIAFSRDGINFYVTGVTAGMIPVSQFDTVKVTYTVKPTMTFIPR